MKRHWKIKIVAIELLIALLISFPFFKLEYFETLTTLHIIYKYFLLPTAITSCVLVTVIYFKYLRKLNPRTESKGKIFFQDFFSISILSGIITATLCGIILSAIITTNAYLEPQKSVSVNAPVIKYEAHLTKYRRLRHEILIINPVDSSSLKLEVYRKYSEGEIFHKGMKLGKWGMLYSFH